MSYVNITYANGEVHEIEDRSVFTKGGGLDLLVEALEYLAVRGWSKSTPTGVTVHLADGRDVRIDAGREFLNSLTMGAPVREWMVQIPVVEITPRQGEGGWTFFDWPKDRIAMSAERPVWLIGGCDVNAVDFHTAELND